MERLKEWLVAEQVVEALLRSHLHQAQFAEVLRKALGRLLVLGILSQDHLDALWRAADRAHALQAVRENALDVIAQLAPGMPHSLLDVLMERVRATVTSAGAETGTAMMLVAALMRSDKRGGMAQEVFGLAWELAKVPAHLR